MENVKQQVQPRDIFTYFVLIIDVPAAMKDLFIFLFIYLFKKLFNTYLN